MPNPFDQFDSTPAPAATANAFDQFDSEPVDLAAAVPVARAAPAAIAAPVAVAEPVDEEPLPFFTMLRERAQAGLEDTVGGGVRAVSEQLQAPFGALRGTALDSLVAPVADVYQPGIDAGTELGDLAAATRTRAQVGEIAAPQSIDELVEAISSDPEGGVRYLAGIGAESMPAILAALATRNPNAATRLVGLTTGATTYGQARQDDADPYQAIQQAISSSLLEMGLGQAPFDEALGGAGMGRRLLTVPALEAVTEGATGTGQAVTSDIIAGRPVDSDAALAEGLIGALVGGPMGVAEAVGGRGPGPAAAPAAPVPGSPAEPEAPIVPPAAPDAAPATLEEAIAAVASPPTPDAPEAAAPAVEPETLEALLASPEFAATLDALAGGPAPAPPSAASAAAVPADKGGSPEPAGTDSPRTLDQALAMDEDAYIQAVNPTGKRSSPEDTIAFSAGDIQAPADATPDAALGFKDKQGRDVAVLRAPDGTLYAKVGDQTVGSIESREGETLNAVASDYQGQGIGSGLARALMLTDPMAPAGSFSDAGEAARRSAFRQLRTERAAAPVDLAADIEPGTGMTNTFGDGKLYARMGDRMVEVESPEDASRKFLALKDATDIGGMGVVELVDGSGQGVGYLGHEGEVFEGDFQKRRIEGRKEPVYVPPTKFQPTAAYRQAMDAFMRGERETSPTREEFAAIDDTPDPPREIRYGKPRTPPARGALAAREAELRQQYAPAELVAAEEGAAHTDPGQPPEPATPAVVAEAVQVSAENTPRSLPQAKKFLLDKIDSLAVNASDLPPPVAPVPSNFNTRTRAGQAAYKAAQKAHGEAMDAYANQAGFVTIDVPGDGKFKVRNTKAALADFRAKVDSSPGFRPKQAPPRGPQLPSLRPTPAERAKIMAEAETVDDAPESRNVRDPAKPRERLQQLDGTSTGKTGLQEADEFDAQVADTRRGIRNLQAIVSPQAQAIRRALGAAARHVEVVGSPADLDAATRRRLGPSDRAEGLYDPQTGRVIVFADENMTPERAVWVAFHETAGHLGLRGAALNQASGQRRASGDRLVETLDAAASNPTIRQLADAIRRDSPDYDATRASEEALAEAAAATRTGDYAALERRYGVTIPQAQRDTLRGAIARLVQALRSYLRAVLGRTARFTDADVYQLLADAWAYAETAPVGETGRNGVQPQESRESQPFFSALARSVDQAKGAPKKGDAAAWKGWLDGAQRRGEFKQSERDWLGVDAWLDGHQTTTREELAEFIRANEVKIEETTLGAKPGSKVSPELQGLVNELVAEDDGFPETSQQWMDAARSINDYAYDVRPDLGEAEFDRLIRLRDEARRIARNPDPRAQEVQEKIDAINEALLELPNYEDRTKDQQRVVDRLSFQHNYLADYGVEVSPQLAAFLVDVDTHPNDSFLEWERVGEGLGDMASDQDPDDPDSQGDAYGEMSNEAHRIAREMRTRGEDTVDSRPKFGNYQLPGGQNYRELLLTTPERENVPDGWQVTGAFPKKFDTEKEANEYADNLRATAEAPGMEAIAASLQRFPVGVQQAYKAGPNFQSNHFDQPNILAHVRFNERTDADGKRVLFIEEIQSDWHQQGRKRGYGEREQTVPRRTRMSVRRVPESDRYTDRAGQTFEWGVYDGQQLVSGSFPTELDALNESDRLDPPTETRKVEGIPDAPFKASDEWAMLAFKRMARHAVDNGFDRIAWTTGAQQNARYDLAKQVDSIAVEVQDSGSKDVDILVKGGATVGFIVGNDGVVRNGNQNAGQLNGKTLDEVVGKDMAEKIMATTDDHTFTGVELAIGGEGMRGFYDKILPSAVNKWAKKFGGKVGETRIKTPIADAPSVVAMRDKLGPDYGTSKQHALDITPAMRDAVSAGQPLFSRAPATESQAFRQWFGQSQAVDADGKPLVMYHGTRSREDFDTFDPTRTPEGRQRGEPLIWASASPKFASDWSRIAGGLTSSRVMPVYMKAENPFNPQEPRHIAMLSERLEAAIAGGRASPHLRNAIKNTGNWAVFEHPEVFPLIPELGFDSLMSTEGGADNLAVFTPTQVKSAIGNRGSFDPNSASILESRRPRQDVRRLDSEPATPKIGAFEKELAALRDDVRKIFEKSDRPKNPQNSLERVNGVRALAFDAMMSRARVLKAKYPNSRGLQQLMDTVFTEPGSGRPIYQTLTEGIQQRYSQFSNRWANALAQNGLVNMTKAENVKLRNALLGVGAPAPAYIQKAANDLRKLMDTQATDARTAGLDFGEVTDIGYLTRLYDEARIVENAASEAAFMADAQTLFADHEFPAEVGQPRGIVYDRERLIRFVEIARQLQDPAVRQALTNMRQELLAYRGDSDLQHVRNVETEVAAIYRKVAAGFGAQRAAAWLHGIKTPNMADGFAVVQSPGAPMLKERVLGPAADTVMAKWMVTDVQEILDTYGRAMSRKTEFAQRFGPTGNKVQEYLDQMTREGVATHDSALAAQMAATVAGTMKIPTPTELNAAASWIHAVGYVAMLDKAVISSLAEPVAATMRTGDVRLALGPLVQVARAVRKKIGKPTARGQEVEALAKAIGIVVNNGAEAVLMNQLGGDYALSPKPANLLAGFFRVTLLTALTQSQRVFTTGSGDAYLRSLARSVAGTAQTMGDRAFGWSPAQARAELAELGIADADSFSAWLLAQGGTPDTWSLFDPNGRPTPQGQFYMAAINRFVDQVIQNPNAGMRPQLAAAGPAGRLIYGVTAFSYSFYENLLKGGVKRIETIAKRDGWTKASQQAFIRFAVPAIALAVSQTMVSSLRELLLNPDRWEDMEDDERKRKLIELGLTRSFGLGGLDPIVQYLTGIKYGKSAAETAVGAAPGFFMQNLDGITGLGSDRNSPNTSTTEFRAAQAAYSGLLQPTLNALLVKAGGGNSSVLRAMAAAGIIVGGDKGRDAFASMFGVTPERETELDRNFTKAKKEISALEAEMKGRISRLPKDQWADEFDKLRQEYPELLAGSELMVYKDNAQNRRLGRAGVPMTDADGGLRIRRIESDDLTPRDIKDVNERISDINTILDTLREDRDISLQELTELNRESATTAFGEMNIGSRADLSVPATIAQRQAIIDELEDFRRDLKRDVVERIEGTTEGGTP